MLPYGLPQYVCVFNYPLSSADTFSLQGENLYPLPLGLERRAGALRTGDCYRDGDPGPQNAPQTVVAADNGIFRLEGGCESTPQPRRGSQG